MTEAQNTPTPEQPEKTTVKKRRHGWWWKIPLILIVLLVILILLLPSIASTGPVRNLVLGKVNASLPGKLNVADWSLGWFSGTKAKGVEWTDADGHRVATISEIDTPITLSQLVRGNLHLGEIVVRGVQADIVVPASAQAKAEEQQRAPETHREQPAPAEQKPIQIPDVSAKVRVEDVTGQITFLSTEGKKAVVNLDRTTHLIADLPQGGAPATVDALVAIAQPIGVSNTSVKATVNGIHPGPLNRKAITGNGTVELSQLDLQGVAEILRAMGQEIAITGMLGGKVDITSAGPGQATAKGEFAANNVVAKLTGDQFETKSLRIPVDAEITGGDSAAAIVRQLGVVIDQGQVNVTANVPLKAVDDLQNNRPISQPGSAKVVAQVPNLPVLLNALRNTIKMQQGVQVTGGTFDAQVNVDLAQDGIHVNMPAYLKGLTATKDGKQIALEPVSVEAAARLPSLHTAAQDISDIVLQVRSSFMTLDAKGANLATANAQGQADLVKLRDDFGSIVDLSAIRGGKVTLNVTNRSATQSRMESDIRVQVADLGYQMPATKTTPARMLNGGSLLLTGRSAYENKKLTLTEPLRIQAGGSVLQQQPDQKWKQLLDQSVQMVANGSADLGGNPSVAHVTQLDVTAGKQNPLVKVSLPSNKPLDVALSGKRGVTTDGSLHLWADLAAIQSMVSQMSNTPQQDALRQGTLDTDLGFSVAPDGAVRLQVAKAVSDFVYGRAAATQPYRDHLTADAQVDVPGDNSQAKVMANVNSKLAKLTLDANAGLNPAGQGASMVRSVRVSKLDAQTDFAQVSLVKPVVISDVPALLSATRGGSLPANAEVGGELLITADLGKAVAYATTQPSAAQITGKLTSRQTLSLKQKDIYADTSSEITDFQVVEGGKPVVEDPKLSIGASVHLMPSAASAVLEKLAVTSATGMLDVKGMMQVTKLGTANEFHNARFEFTPDWSKLWPVIYAMLPPEKQQKIGEMIVTGNNATVITIRGEFPTNQPYASAIKQVVVAGSVPLEKVDWKTRGITASGTIPFLLQNGIAYFIQGTPEDPKRVKPLAVNEGTVDISSAKIDLTGDIPRLDIPDKTPLARGIHLNNVMVASLGTYANPLFVDPEKATGRVDVTVVYCRKLPLSTALYDPAAGGEAQFSIDLHNLDMASKGADYFLTALAIEPQKGKDRVVGEVKNGIVTIANGQVTHKMDLQLGDQAFSFDGTMNLSSMSYSMLNAGVPNSVVSTMLDKWFHVQNAGKYLPQKVDLRFSGPASALKLDNSTTQKLVADIAKQQGAEAVTGLLSGGKGKDAKDGKSESTAGSLIDALTGKKDNTSAQPSGQGQQPAPRQQQPSQQQQPPATQPSVEQEVGGLLDMLGGKKK